MTLHLPTLLTVCVAALATSAGVMTFYAATQRTYRGFGAWVAAQWLLALGCLLQLFRDSEPELLPLANLLLLQWPITVLAGMRRFSARQPGRIPAVADWLLLALAWLVWLATWAAGGSLAARVIAFAGGAALLHLYGAVTLWHMAESRHSAAMKLLIALEASAALLQLTRVGAALAGPVDGPGEQLLLASGLVVLVSSLVMVYLALMLTAERSEANLHEVHRQLRFLADIDVLTHVPNRRHFHELAARTLADGARPPCALMMFDVDHFKRINDLLGHASGDEALRQVGRCLRDSLRAPTSPGAWAATNRRAAAGHRPRRRDERRRAHRRAARRPPVAPGIAPLSLSFGIVQLHEGESLAEALRRADRALYEAKRQGRSRAVTAFGIEDEPVFGESSLGLSGF
ncbi:GGDEF domain-containing protein [Piscinibacter aquaticus]|uniref:diguanylate cyclase n=1 Tax=Piscinibacter aquaticus TaxID=392597 RepID=A0A5C6U1R1_9BURK|nr:GGDEF domain-containing protein [Piscinibacter aquaticus]